LEDFEPELQRMVRNKKGTLKTSETPILKASRMVLNPESSPERRPQRTEIMKTPPKERFVDSSPDSEKSGREEIDGNSYIKQYYLKKYGSAKKGFDPRTEIVKKNASDRKISMAERTPL